MEKFRTIDDVEAWLEPMNYEQFWREIRPYCLVLEYRSVCDVQIATGKAARRDVLIGLKMMACHELTRRHRLRRRPATPWLTVVE
jgi:hypothetical protein